MRITDRFYPSFRWFNSCFCWLDKTKFVRKTEHHDHDDDDDDDDDGDYGYYFSLL